MRVYDLMQSRRNIALHEAAHYVVGQMVGESHDYIELVKGGRGGYGGACYRRSNFNWHTMPYRMVYAAGPCLDALLVCNWDRTQALRSVQRWGYAFFQSSYKRRCEHLALFKPWYEDLIDAESSLPAPNPSWNTYKAYRGYKVTETLDYWPWPLGFDLYPDSGPLTFSATLDLVIDHRKTIEKLASKLLSSRVSNGKYRYYPTEIPLRDSPVWPIEELGANGEEAWLEIFPLIA